MLRGFVHPDDAVAALFVAATGAALSAPADVDVGRALRVGDTTGTMGLGYGSERAVATGRHRFGDVRHAASDVGPTLRGLPGRWTWLRLERSLERLITRIEAQLQEVAA